ncbi:hypothetical protein [Haloarcula marina]|uniref:hypothetical protein n=1 Tax=Haloarcula marina TaxID=2961574 RepID=UPI0020B6AA89|nr:hypothetical protein [Halomicroarcula marina]
MLSAFLWEFLLPLAFIAVLLVAIDRYQDLRLLAYLTADRERTVAFVGGVAFVLVVTGATYALGSPPSIGGRYDVSLYHVGFVVLLVGVFITVHGLRHYGLATTLRKAAHVDPSGTLPDGPVAVTGVAESAVGTVSAPQSGESALVAEAGQLAGGEKYAASASTGRAQQLLDAERVGRSFDVTDEYGAVRVDPADATIGFVVGEPDGGTLERRVEPGDSVTVVGRAEGGRLAETLVVASAGNHNVDRFAGNVPRLAKLGPFVVLVGVGVMAVTAGVV